MANYAKWGKGAAGHMCKHFERAKDENGEYVKFGNRDIDPERSHLNYNLGPERENQYGFIADRCKELGCLKRKDVNVLSSWIVTAPTDLPDEKLQEFFQASYDALEKNYGRDNVVSAHVHMDESGRPHMHFAFVPVVWDKKKEAWKVSAKQCVTRSDLQKFHPWLEQELRDRLGYQVNVINDATKEGNKTVTQLKQERELAKQAELAERTSEAQKELSAALEELGKVNAALEGLQAKIKPSEAAVADLRDMDELADRAGKTLTGKVVRSKKDDEMLRKAAAHGATVDHHLRTAQDKLRSAEHMLANEKSMGDMLRGDIKRLQGKVKQLEGAVKDLTQTAAWMDEFHRQMAIKAQIEAFIEQRRKEYEKQLRQEQAAERRQAKVMRREMER